MEGHALGVVSVDTSFDGKCEYLSFFYVLFDQSLSLLLWHLKYWIVLCGSLADFKTFLFAVIATSSLDSFVRIWELQSGEKKQTIEAGPVDVWSVMFTPDSKYIISGSHAGKINWYNVDTGKPHQSYDTRGKFTLSIACVSEIIQVYLWTFYQNLNFLFVFQSPDMKFVASGAMDGIINVFDIATGKLVHTLEGSF